ncbi:LRR receptor-like serine/threonine-protein kinase RGI3 [Oryza brachyantha]|uniref:LRR receptor-like serine/threonine-protein kinase RGI3 n=1 Tax=Oryza brachyantha TaxID=4533 RepID=UPI001AD99CF9|nr:LRR receptor-like serine/threonine-protein kinase RGI3 [Oryza brachyantha]
MPPRLRATAARLLVLLACACAVFVPPCRCASDQGEALLRWKASLTNGTRGGGGGGALDSWRASDASPCRWLGVSCDARGDVVAVSIKSVDLGGALPAVSLLPLARSLKTLVLSGTNLTGVIPKELGDLAELNTLDLTKNQLSGAIPEELCRLRKLQSLALNSNSLRGAIPDGIGNLTSLTSLTLYDNELSGTIPASIGNLKKLQVLRAGGNQALKGPLPPEIGGCSDLTMLGLAETGLSGSLPETIGNLKKIQTIAIYTAMLTGSIPESIGNCTELTSLYLYQNTLSGGIPPQLGQLRKLQTVLLWQNQLVGTIPPEIGNCKELVLIDLSLNELTGPIPRSFGSLPNLQQLQLSTNKLTGVIPPELSNCTSLTDIEVDNNQLTGVIGIDFLRLRNLTLFYAWQNQLTGGVPASLAQCESLQSLDLSYNNLTGPVPRELFALQNLTKILLLSNDLSGFIPPEIGNCTNLYRLRLNENRLSGTIPAEIGNLKNLNFLDLGNNRLTGPVPVALSGCDNLEFMDLHSNVLTGTLPEKLPRSLQFVDISDNRITGVLGAGIGSLPELTKLNLGKNRISGGIPPELGSCEKLQLLDLGDNALAGGIPPELGKLPSLEISLNLSCNRLSGEIPSQFGGLDKLGCLDVSYNQLSGSLEPLARLENLVTLNISYNDFSGELPDTPFFQKLPINDIAGNHLLVVGSGGDEASRRAAISSLKLAMTVLAVVSALLLLSATYVLARSRRNSNGSIHGADERWEVTLYQKLDFSVDEVVRSLTSANVIGTGSSGVVYRVGLPNGDSLAVKKMWSSDEAGAFRNEITALGSIRHRNIVRLLGWGANRSTKLLFYTYLPNGSLSGFLHRGGVKGAAEWAPRYDIALGVAHAVAYLHHDCLPAILHGDIKAMNVLLGPRNEPYLADFGLARVLSGAVGSGSAKLDSSKPRIAGSYGYIAPEYASMQRITEKSDVYSFGVVALEILTGRHPLDPTLPGGTHLVQWVREHLQAKRAAAELLDPRLRGKPEAQVQEMLQVFSVAVLCIAHRADDRPAMKDVVALLKEIRRPAEGAGGEGKEQTCGGTAAAPPPPAAEQRSPARSALPNGGSFSCSFAMSDYSS